MRQVRVSVFKVRYLKIMDEIQSTGEPVVITKRGAAVVKIVPTGSKHCDPFGFMAGEFRIVGDIESPITPQKHPTHLK